jgi:hypothetical protein
LESDVSDLMNLDNLPFLPFCPFHEQLFTCFAVPQKHFSFPCIFPRPEKGESQRTPSCLVHCAHHHINGCSCHIFAFSPACPRFLVACRCWLLPHCHSWRRPWHFQYFLLSSTHFTKSCRVCCTVPSCFVTPSREDVSALRSTPFS